MYLWVSRLLALSMVCETIESGHTHFHVAYKVTRTHTVALFHPTRQRFSPPGPLFLKVYLHGSQQTQIVWLSGAVHADKEPEA